MSRARKRLIMDLTRNVLPVVISIVLDYVEARGIENEQLGCGRSDCGEYGIGRLGSGELDSSRLGCGKSLVGQSDIMQDEMIHDRPEDYFDAIGVEDDGFLLE